MHDTEQNSSCSSPSCRALENILAALTAHSLAKHCCSFKRKLLLLLLLLYQLLWLLLPRLNIISQQMRRWSCVCTATLPGCKQVLNIVLAPLLQAPVSSCPICSRRTRAEEGAVEQAVVCSPLQLSLRA